MDLSRVYRAGRHDRVPREQLPGPHPRVDQQRLLPAGRRAGRRARPDHAHRRACPQTGLAMAKIFRDGEQWRFRAIGEGIAARSSRRSNALRALPRRARLPSAGRVTPVQLRLHWPYDDRMTARARAHATAPLRRRRRRGPRAGDPRRHPRAVRRARRARRADRGHRPGGRDQPGDRLPALHRQGGALRAHAGRLPRRAARRAGDAAAPQDARRDAARGDRRRVRRLRPRAPGVRRLRPDADAAQRPRAARRDLRERAVPARPRHLRRAWPRSAARSRTASPPATSRSTTRRCSPTRSTPAGSARCSSPGSASSSRRPPPASPPSARSPPSRSRTTWSRSRAGAGRAAPAGTASSLSGLVPRLGVCRLVARRRRPARVGDGHRRRRRAARRRSSVDGAPSGSRPAGRRDARSGAVARASRPRRHQPERDQVPGGLVVALARHVRRRRGRPARRHPQGHDRVVVGLGCRAPGRWPSTVPARGARVVDDTCAATSRPRLVERRARPPQAAAPRRSGHPVRRRAGRPRTPSRRPAATRTAAADVRAGGSAAPGRDAGAGGAAPCPARRRRADAGGQDGRGASAGATSERRARAATSAASARPVLGVLGDHLLDQRPHRRGARRAQRRHLVVEVRQRGGDVGLAAEGLAPGQALVGDHARASRGPRRRGGAARGTARG